MCGIVGVYGHNLGKEDSEAMQMLLHFDTLRGKDSTGVARIADDGTVEIFKELGPPMMLYHTYQDKFYNDMLPLFKHKMMLGHNRWATQGAVDVNNAHPFDMGRVVGVHNGTVNLYSLNKLDGYKEHNMDSKIIFQHINNNPNDLQGLWSEADGPMTLVWWDKEEQDLHFVRNEKRPLFVAVTDKAQKLYWASEKWMLAIALQKANIKFEKVYDVEPNKHYSCKVVDKEVKMYVTDLKPFQPKALPPQDKWWEGYRKKWYEAEKEETVEFFLTAFLPSLIEGGVVKKGYFLGKSSFKENVKLVVNEINDEVNKLRDAIEEGTDESVWNCDKARSKWSKEDGSIFYCEWEDCHQITLEDTAYVAGEYLTKTLWDIRTRDGCANCTTNLDWKDRAEIKWKDKFTPICFKCQNNVHNLLH